MLFLMKISSFFPVMPAVVGLFALSACGHIITKSHTYQKSQAVEINGAKVTGSVKPNLVSGSQR